MRQGAALLVGLLLLLESCGGRTDPWAIPGLSGSTTSTGSGGSGNGIGSGGTTTGFGSGTTGVGGAGIGTGSGTGGAGTGAGGSGAGGSGIGGSAGAGTGTGGSGAGGSGTGGAGTGGTGTGGTGTGGAAGSGTGGVGGGGAGGTGGFSGGAPDGGTMCFQPLSSAATSFDLYLLLDKSSPMGLVDPPDVAPNTRWARVTRAIETLSRRSDLPIRMGLGFFPLTLGTAGPTCTVLSYSTANVAIHRAYAGSAMIQAMAAQSPGDETWTRPALEGALSYAFYWTVNDHPVDDPASLLPPCVVLLTGALPVGCGGTVNDLANAAAASFHSTRIRTHVVAIGADAKGLEPVAVAGGTHRVYASQSGDLDEIFTRIAKSRVVCDIPFAPHDPPNVSRLEVRVRLTTSEPMAAIPRRADPESCGTEGGWFLEPLTKPTMIMLCPGTCAAVVDAPAGQVMAGQVICP